MPYLFIVRPGHSRGYATAPRADQMEAAARAWASLNDAGVSDLAGNREDFARVKADVAATRIAAMGGDRDAVARLARFARAMAAARAAGAALEVKESAGSATD